MAEFKDIPHEEKMTVDGPKGSGLLFATKLLSALSKMNIIKMIKMECSGNTEGRGIIKVEK